MAYAATGQPFQTICGFGKFPLLLNPLTVDDKGLVLVVQDSKVATIWSIDNTTTSVGAKKRPVGPFPFPETYEWDLPQVPGGNQWLSAKVLDGKAVLLKKPEFPPLKPTLSFLVTTNPAAIKAFAGVGGTHMVVDGPAFLIAQAQGIVPPGVLPPPSGKCPPDTFDVFGFCIPRPGFPTPAVCPAGTTGTPPNCVPVVPQVCPAGTTGVFPNCVPVEPPPEKPEKPPPEPELAKAAVPAWVAPVIIGIGAVALISLLGMRRSR